MKQKLSEYLKYWRADRPDEWTMDGFIRGAEKLEATIEALEARGLAELGEAKLDQMAMEIMEPRLTTYSALTKS